MSCHESRPTARSRPSAGWRGPWRNSPRWAEPPRAEASRARSAVTAGPRHALVVEPGPGLIQHLVGELRVVAEPRQDHRTDHGGPAANGDPTLLGRACAGDHLAQQLDA